MPVRKFAGAATVIALVAIVHPLRAQEPMAKCEHHQEMTAALKTIEKLVADTKPSKDPVAMRAALDEIGAQVAKLQAGGKKCADMMDMMKKMEKMHPTPNTETPAPPHEHK
jgi:hypothetical protein